MNSSNSNSIKTVPDNYTAVTPWLITPSTAQTISFLESVFGAEEIPNSRLLNNEGIVIHAVVKLGDAMILLFDSRHDWGPTPAFLNLYVKDVEATLQRALQAGATTVTDLTTLWFGEKVCRILDPFGNLFWINERIEVVDFTNPDEVRERASTPEAINGIAYIQRSLDDALKMQKAFFDL
ncbi:MAG: VOC family protein [Chitinophagaceae bacterium]|nr:MAG: VOC family protein [Chitinophagaceae bacterium]